MDGRAADGLQVDLKNLLRELGQLHQQAKQTATQKQSPPPRSDGSLVVRGK